MSPQSHLYLDKIYQLYDYCSHEYGKSHNTKLHYKHVTEKVIYEQFFKDSLGPSQQLDARSNLEIDDKNRSYLVGGIKGHP